MSDRSFTKEQEIIVEKILKHKSHEYYKILEIEKTAGDSEIKKAYRKISLKIHPDKNGHPKADECFKKVNKAFEILGDPSKKRIYDQTGVDPDSRGASSNASSGFNQFNGQQFHGFGHSGASPFGGGGGGGFQADDLFDILFGGGPMGGMNGMGGTSFTFGGPNGFTFASNAGSPFGGAFPRQSGTQRRRRTNPSTNQRSSQDQDNQQQQSTLDILKQLAPMILMLLIPFISNLFSDSNTENFQFIKTSLYNQERVTSGISIPYYLTKQQINKLSSKKLEKLDKAVEHQYVDLLKNKCTIEKNEKDRQINDAHGWIFTDEEKLTKAHQIKLPNCEELQRIGRGFL
ncbi:hypothetical protein WICMUC_004119 [Wickerhamomyces mucosus]|uniref:J domain-containing protein n=1 Tax=Wickerhamomyces mucosus TaxID=1378264 RepID=A0A9P8PI84_9ASCO|nr:hypothetical protein WICMUC_004119 [Wickerhamomyces mucosus]